jgi:hypothetical protein
MELDPLYVDIILRRYEAVTGRQGILEKQATHMPRWRNAGGASPNVYDTFSMGGTK